MPTTKVSVGALAGALSVIAVWGLGFYGTVPNSIAQAITVVVTFATSYFVKD